MTTTPRIACALTATVAETAHADAEFKKSMRLRMRATRMGLAAPLRASQDAAIAVNIERWLAHHPVSLLGVYWPIHGEPALHDLYARLAAAGVGLALPNVTGRGLPLQFLTWAPGDALILGREGIATPARVETVQPQAMLIPCVAFNSANFRLGFGGGYYDRTLAQAPQATAIGVAYSCTQADFSAAAHDIAMQVVITETASFMREAGDARSP